MSKKLVRERDVEKALGKIVEGGGGLYEKFSSPGRRDVPDRLVIEGHGLDRAAHLLHDLLKENNSAEPADRPLATHEGRRAAVRALIAQVIYFVECKAPGKKPTKRQHRDHEKRRARGLTVHVYDGEWR